MINIISHFCDYHKDRKRLMDFWLDVRAVSDVRLYPTIWRIRLLLSSRVWEPEKDTCIWENETGKIIAFAMLWRRFPTSPYLVLDGYVHRDFVAEQTLLAILLWGEGRAQEIVDKQEAELPIIVSGLSRYPAAPRILAQLGYNLSQPNPEDARDIYFSRTLTNEIPLPDLPAGYSIRSLKDASELESYQAMSGFAKVDPEHQKELIESDEYHHLVATDRSGELAAYCEFSICRAEWERTGRRIGWIDYIETIERHQKKGLGMAVLLAGLAKLKEWGAETAMLVTISVNTPAVNLYNKAGFELLEIQDSPAYTKQLS